MTRDEMIELARQVGDEDEDSAIFVMRIADERLSEEEKSDGFPPKVWSRRKVT